MSAAAPVAVVTGATGGLGQPAAIELARRGANVVMVGRDRGRTEAARDAVHADAPRAELEVRLADLSSLQSVRQLATEIAATHPRIQALVHTAAIYAGERRLTVDGFESMFAINHLAPYLLTRLLLPVLRAGAPSRVVVVTAPSSTRPVFTDLQGSKEFRALRAFGASKAGNLLFAAALRRRLAGSAVEAAAFHPGLIRSGLMGEAPGPLKFFLGLISRSPAAAAGALADLALVTPSPLAAFYVRAKPTQPPKPSQEEAAQEEIWRVSARLAGLPEEMAAA